MATTSQVSFSGLELDSPTCVSEPNNKKRWQMPFATKSKKSKVSPDPANKNIIIVTNDDDVVVEPHPHPHQSSVSHVPSNRVVVNDPDVVVQPRESTVSPVPTDGVVIGDLEVSPVPTDRVVVPDVVVEPQHESMVSPVPSDRVVVIDVEPVQESNVSPVPINSFGINVLERRPRFSNIDQPSLTQFVKQKNLNQLVEYDGIAGLANALKTNLRIGINGDDQDISDRHEDFGTNTYRMPPPPCFYHFVWEASKDSTILILLVCAALSLGFGIKEQGPKKGWYDGGSILVAAFLVMVVSAISSFWQKRHFVNLSKVSNIPVDVARNGMRQQVSSFEIVVGDVVYLQIGHRVPADGLFIDGHSLQVDESSMAGGSDCVEVNEQNPFFFSGTTVIDGSGRMLVTSVGINTTWGEMMSNHDSNEQTPLQARINKLTLSIGKIDLALSFLVLVILLAHYFTRSMKDENGNTEFNGSKTKVDDVIKFVGQIASVVVTIIVAIPKGLPLVIKLILAYTMKRMMVFKVMVRKLSACETIGSLTTICTDKTGILTLNQMKVTKFWLGQESIDERVFTSIADNVRELLYQGVGLNTTGTVHESLSGSEFEFSGSPTEKAILSWAVLELNMDMAELKHNYTIQHVEPFNSTKKRSGISMRKRADNTINVHWKGDAEIVLAMSSQYYDFSGNIKALDDVERMKFDQIIQGMAASNLKCIAFAHKQILEYDNEHEESQGNIKDNCLTLLGLVGIKDPCRPCVQSHLEDLQYIGVNIKMITGDNVSIAKAVAIECGILRPNQGSGGVVEGVEFRNYDPMERMRKVGKISVMARSSPTDKLLMVECLKQRGDVVAVTGDGINDVKALREADIGLSMGILGAEVAKENSDIVILDNEFGVVYMVILWGRRVYKCIQKFIQFQLTMNVAALVINFVAIVSVGEVPLTVFQLLWVNLIMDTLGALALATETLNEELMEKLHVDRTNPHITNIMWRNILAQAFYQIVVLLTLQFKGESIFGVNGNVNNTLIFNTFALCQVFNEFNARKLEKKNIFEGIHRSKLFLVIIGITILLQVVMVEFLQKFANTERLNWWQWGVCFGFAIVCWPIGWLVKWLPVPEKPFISYLKR